MERKSAPAPWAIGFKPREFNTVQDVAVAGPGTFYVANGTAGKNPLIHIPQTYGILPGGNILYFNGMAFREAVDEAYLQKQREHCGRACGVVGRPVGCGPADGVLVGGRALCARRR